MRLTHRCLVRTEAERMHPNELVFVPAFLVGLVDQSSVWGLRRINVLTAPPGRSRGVGGGSTCLVA